MSKNSSMKFRAIYSFVLFIGLALPLGFASKKLAPTKKELFYSLSAKSIEGSMIDFSVYRGKVILAVNVASQCGYTPQYSGLQKLYEKFSDRGLIILGFPSNDFGGQEPGTDAEIKSFCSLKYEVKFPIFSKGPVVGQGKQPVFKFLTETVPTKGEVQWNFEKFLIDRQGHVVQRFRSAVAPENSDLVRSIENELKATAR